MIQTVAAYRLLRYMKTELYEEARMRKSYFDATLDSKGIGRGGLREGFSYPSFLQHGSERDHTSQSRSMLLYVMKLHMNFLKRIII